MMAKRRNRQMIQQGGADEGRAQIMDGVMSIPKPTELSSTDTAVKAEAPPPLTPTPTPSTIDSAAPPVSVSAAAKPKGSFPEAPAVPTQEGPLGIRFDFNQGARVKVPDGAWRIQLRDLDTNNILFNAATKASFVVSSKRFYVRFSIEVWKDEVSVFRHEYDATDREVLVNLPVGTLGDTLGWFPYVEKMRQKLKCRMSCGMNPAIIPLLQPAYPDITFVPMDDIKPALYYATYNIGLFFDDADLVYQPTDFRLVGLHRTAGYILGVDPVEVPPKLILPDESRPIPEPYVCIAVQASTQAKKWNNPHGWADVIRFLKDRGYRVTCIDREPVHGQGVAWTHLPHGAEDETGNRPLIERARWLRHADAFIGPSSGLVWLAWAAKCPTVMISGFTHPTNEFATEGRVINWHTCNSCWNDPRHRFDHKDFLWCPRHKGTDRQFECTRLITAEQVKRAAAAVLPPVVAKGIVADPIVSEIAAAE
jgi:autotransporter strand-loop-strand O-heptosyltransferase